MNSSLWIIAVFTASARARQGVFRYAVRQRLGVLGFITMLSIGMSAAGQIANYDGDPDLATAISHDLELNGGEYAMASQQLAAKHYLLYLERAQDPDQRARVYVQLGALFSTNWIHDAGEQPDYEKARRYFEEALRLAPDKVGAPMIRARLARATPLQNTEERIAIRLAALDWISTLDEARIRAQWLPLRPGEPPTDLQIRQFQRLLENVVSAETENILAGSMLIWRRGLYYGRRP